MLKKVVGTTGSKVISALISFLIVTVNARFLGAEGVGEIGLVVLGITIVGLLNDFIGGNAMVYFIPRLPIGKLLLPSYIWAIITSVIGVAILHVFKLIPSEYSFHVLFLSLIHSYYSIHLRILLGKEDIKAYNIISVLQIIVVASILCAAVFVFQFAEVLAYVYALYAAYLLCMFISFVAIYSYLKNVEFKGMVGIVKQLVKLGFYVQLANILQILNYRLCYFFLASYTGIAELGVYAVAIQVSEALWVISKSMAMILYARISNSTDFKKNVETTIIFFKISFYLSITMIMVLFIIPESFFVFLFGENFIAVKNLIYILGPGVVFVAGGSMFSHFFSGTGRQHLNSIGSGIGFVMMIITGFVFVPKYGITGAAIATSLSYLSSLCFQLIVFFRITRMKFSSIVIRKNDFVIIRTEVKKYFRSYNFDR